MASVNVTIRMDEDLKEQAEKLFKELGLNLTAAFNVFAKTAVREQRIPFELTLHPIQNIEDEKCVAHDHMEDK